jgi:HK97 family phage portal protein
MSLFNKKKEIEQRDMTVDSVLLSALLNKTTITRETALEIPTVASCVELISNTVAMLPIKLYSEENGTVKELKDYRYSLLNEDTNDILTGYILKKNLIKDYLLDGSSFAYINRQRNNIVSLNYVKHNNISFMVNADPIFKTVQILCNGKIYEEYQWLKVIRNSNNGVSGQGVIEGNSLLLNVCYAALKYELLINQTGGNKKGFLQSGEKIDKPSMDAIKESWQNLYKGNTENMLFLNNGITFHEFSSTAVETQMNENKQTNATEINKIFNIPVPFSYSDFIKQCIQPILTAFESACNRDLLLPSENKQSYYFAFDTKEIIKSSIQERYAAYTQAVQAGWMSKNEIRYSENLEPIEGLDIVTMNLADVIYDIKTHTYFTPNTKTVLSTSLEPTVTDTTTAVQPTNDSMTTDTNVDTVQPTNVLPSNTDTGE